MSPQILVRVFLDQKPKTLQLRSCIWIMFHNFQQTALRYPYGSGTVRYKDYRVIRAHVSPLDKAQSLRSPCSLLYTQWRH